MLRMETRASCILAGQSQGMPSPLRSGLASCLSVRLSVRPSVHLSSHMSTIHSHFTASILGVQAHLSSGQSTHLFWLQLGHPTEAPAGPSMGDESLVLTGVEPDPG